MKNSRCSYEKVTLASQILHLAKNIFLIYDNLLLFKLKFKSYPKELYQTLLECIKKS